jgi:hypothetical protein
MDRVLSTLTDYLTGNTSSPDSVISQPFTQNLFVIGTMRDFSDVDETYNGVQVISRIIGNNPNPKWLRDFYTIAVQVIGKDRSKYIECENLIHDIFDTLHGSDNLIFGNSAYFQFTSDEGPYFVSYYEDSMPLFTFILRFYVDGLEDKNNRKALK